MEQRMSSVEEHNEEELHSDLDDDNSSVKATQRPPKGTKPSSSSLNLCSSNVDSETAFLSPLQLLFVCILLLIQFYCLFVHGLFGFLSRLEFLPLLLTSVSCAVGVVWSWFVFYHQVVFSWLNCVLVTSLIFLSVEGLTLFWSRVRLALIEVDPLQSVLTTVVLYDIVCMHKLAYRLQYLLYYGDSIVSTLHDNNY